MNVILYFFSFQVDQLCWKDTLFLEFALKKKKYCISNKSKYFEFTVSNTHIYLDSYPDYIWYIRICCLYSYRRFNHFDELSGRFWLRSWAGSADSLDNPAFTRSDELLHLRALDRPCCYHDDTLSLASTCPSHGTRLNTIYPHRYTHTHTEPIVQINGYVWVYQYFKVIDPARW